VEEVAGEERRRPEPEIALDKKASISSVGRERREEMEIPTEETVQENR